MTTPDQNQVCAAICFSPSPTALDIRLSGSLTFAGGLRTAPNIAEQTQPKTQRVRVIDDGIANWDSALLTFLLQVRAHCQAHKIEFDLSAAPDGVRELIRLATAVAPRTETTRKQVRPSLLASIGIRAEAMWRETCNILSFLGEVTVSIGRLLSGRARYRPRELWLTVQQCGPQALGIVTIITVLVGAILALVGAIQLKLFGAELYVANLVGIGMVIEMGALMTGIILAGRTGAAFAAQLGSMQVSEEVDALKTMGIPPIDYLVLPRMMALVLMTPLLVIYADVLGILGGAAVGIFVLDIPSTLFFSQTIEMMSVWQVTQGLIKGATFGGIVAFAGCLRGMQCGRSASAVGDAATSAVVTSLLGIVLADALWTFIFLAFGGA